MRASQLLPQRGMNLKQGAEMRWLLTGALMLAGCMGGYNRPMELVSGSHPEYPSEARAAGVEGFVVVRYDVTREGRVINAEVVAASPPGTFDAAALRAVTSWVFKPAVRDGETQSERALQSTVDFKIGTGSEYADY